MIYGTLCFAILFSFVGTVLGGLWADDSWGRFWGWDPKENGALIIVLWNAMVLHARRGGLIKQRGLAILAVAGNIAVSWSWFGVNELGIGLHSYGFTEGALKALGIFVGSQLAIVALGLLPESSVDEPSPTGTAEHRDLRNLLDGVEAVQQTGRMAELDARTRPDRSSPSRVGTGRVFSLAAGVSPEFT